MNKEYIYTGGKVTIVDDKGKIKQEKYYDNIDEILIEENIIETMENEAERLKKEWKRYENSKTDKLLWMVPILGCGIISLIAPLILISTLTKQNIFSLANDAFYSHYILSLTSMIFPAGLFFGAIISAMEYIEYRKNIKTADGINSQLDYLKEQVMTKKEALKKLQDDKTNANENFKTRIVKVDDALELQKIKSELEQYYELGYNMNKYLYYYEKGKLLSKLPENMDANLAQKHLKQKKLVKKK